MNDDLRLVLVILTHCDSLIKVAVRIEHGINDDFWGERYLDFHKDDVVEAYKKILPDYVSFSVKKILYIDTDLFAFVDYKQTPNDDDAKTRDFDINDLIDESHAEDVDEINLQVGEKAWFWLTDVSKHGEVAFVPFLMSFLYRSSDGKYHAQEAADVAFDGCVKYEELARERSVDWKPVKGEKVLTMVHDEESNVYGVPFLVTCSFLSEATATRKERIMVDEFDRLFPSNFYEFTGVVPKEPYDAKKAYLEKLRGKS